MKGDPTLSQVIGWVFQAIITAAVMYGVNVLGDLKKSVEVLNVNVATVIEKTAWQEKELTRDDERLQKLEGNRAYETKRRREDATE